jgi:hypothetical protein
MNLFIGKSELDAYQLASESLSAAREMHFKRLEATLENALALNRRQIAELLTSGQNNRAIDPLSAKGFRRRVDKALADRSVDALAQIRRELAELFELAEQAEADKANEAGREWEELVQATAHRQQEESDGGEKYRTKI